MHEAHQACRDKCDKPVDDPLVGKVVESASDLTIDR